MAAHYAKDDPKVKRLDKAARELLRAAWAMSKDYGPAELEVDAEALAYIRSSLTLYRALGVLAPAMGSLEASVPELRANEPVICDALGRMIETMIWSWRGAVRAGAVSEGEFVQVEGMLRERIALAFVVGREKDLGEGKVH